LLPPAVFSKVAFSLSPQKIKELWIVPLGFVVVTGTSMSVAWAMGTIFRLKKSQKAFAMAASGFMNSNSLPIALMQSLVVEVPGLKVRAGALSEVLTCTHADQKLPPLALPVSVGL
jgi:predicted permease